MWGHTQPHAVGTLARAFKDSRPHGSALAHKLRSSDTRRHLVLYIIQYHKATYRFTSTFANASSTPDLAAAAKAAAADCGWPAAAAAVV